MTNQIFYAAMRDDRLLDGTISTSEQLTETLAYNQAYNDASDDLADDHLLNPEADVDAQIESKWYYDVVKFTKAELIDVIIDTQNTYCEFMDETPETIIERVLDNSKPTESDN